MKKFNGRKLLALMMTLIMLLSLMPAVFADGEAEAAPAVQDGETPAEPTPVPVEPTPELTYLAQIGDVKYETLDDAVKAAQSGDVIELLDNCTSGGMDLSKSITIKGNYSITFAGKGIALHGAALTFDGCTIVMTGIGATGNAELGWMTIALGSGSSLNLSGASMTLDGSGVESNVHAVYCTGNNTINVAGSSLTIKNYPQDAIEWDGGSAEYSVNISGGSTVVLDHNRSGFTGTFKVHSVGSTVKVTNSSGNASNGTDFVFDGGVVDFSGNASHAISSTNEMTFKGGVNAKINNNGLCAMYINTGKISISADSTVEVSGNGKSEAAKGADARGTINIAKASASLEVAPGATFTVTDNYTSAIRNNGTVTLGSGVIMRNGSMIPYGGGLNNFGAATIAEGAALYNNHATASGDDIASTGTLNIAKTGEGWALDGTEGTNDCTSAIDGWYKDGTEKRWNTHSLSDLFAEAVEAGSIEAPVYLKAAHGIGAKEHHEPAELIIFKADSVSKAAAADAEFTVYGDAECKNVIGSGKTDKDGLLTISKLEPGSYYIKETKAPKGFKLNTNVYEIKVTETKGDTNVVVENGEAVSVTEFAASAALLLNGSDVEKTENGQNAYPTITDEAVAAFTVRKVWVDNGVKTGRTPVEISLSANGKQIEKFELNEKNGWEKSFELAKYDENGKEIKYTAVEITKVTGYVTGYSADTFTVYNTLESLKPKTGDDSNLMLWTMLGLSALLCAGGVGILMYKKSRNAG